jgi:hypothetical protein
MASHHYLPRFYLRHFLVPPERAGRKNHHVLVLRTLTSHWEEIHPDGLGAEDDLNTTTTANAEESDVVEHELQKLDDAMARVIRDYIQPRRRLLEKHRETVARFAAASTRPLCSQLTLELLVNRIRERFRSNVIASEFASRRFFYHTYRAPN